jgi:hypothetical protein
LFDGAGEVSGAAAEVEGLDGGVEDAGGLEGGEEVPAEEPKKDHFGNMQDEMEDNAEADSGGKKSASRSKSSSDGGDGDKDKKKAAGIGGGIGAAFALGGLAAAIGGPAGDFFADTVEAAAEGDSEEEDDDEDGDVAKKREGTEKKKKGRFASLSKFSDVVKEHVITAVAGEDAFEAMEELQEEAEKNKEEEEEEDNGDDDVRIEGVDKKGDGEAKIEENPEQDSISSTRA